MIKQNLNAKTVIIFNWEDEGVGSLFGRLLHWVTVCKNHGFYLVFNSSHLRFSEFFENFWDEKTDQEMLDKAKEIYIFSSYKVFIPKYQFDHTKIKQHYSQKTLGVRIFCAHKIFDEPCILDRAGNDQAHLGDDLYIYSKNFSVYHGATKDICKFKNNIMQDFENLKTSLQLPDVFDAVQIRRGDRAGWMTWAGYKNPTERQFIEKLKEERTEHLKDIFIATDDPQVAQNLRHEFPEFNFYSIAERNNNPHSINNNHQTIFYTWFDVEMCRRAEHYVGSDVTFGWLITFFRDDDDKKSYIIPSERK